MAIRVAAVLESVAKDIRFACRSLVRRPAFTTVALLTLALGIGVNTAIFSVVDGILLRPLPFASPERLVALWPGHALANREVEYLRAHARSYEAVGSYSPGWLVALTGVDVPQQLNAARLSGNLFGILGVQPALGRVFGMEAERPGDDRVTVLGFEVWRSQFGSDPGVIGRTIILDGDPHTVIGVTP